MVNICRHILFIAHFLSYYFNTEPNKAYLQDKIFTHAVLLKSIFDTLKVNLEGHIFGRQEIF